MTQTQQGVQMGISERELDGFCTFGKGLLWLSALLRTQLTGRMLLPPPNQSRISTGRLTNA